MRHAPINSLPATAFPTITDIRHAWRADRCVQESSAAVYLLWIKRFRAYCTQRGLTERTELTWQGARRFAAAYARCRHFHSHTVPGACTALYALFRVYQVMELELPAWRVPPRVRPPTTALLRAYADHLARQRGSPAGTVHKKLNHVVKVLDHLATRHKTWRTMTLCDIDEFLVACARRYARATTAGIASTLRSFTRFLLVTGRISVDLADSVISPVQPRYERPLRALPWADVQRLLRAVDTSSVRGLRDYALLLMMSVYGLGAGEVIGLQLQDIDWNVRTLKVIRPKTGVTFLLPLLPAVARALARYLHHSRPSHTPTRHVFVQMKMPFGPFRTSSPVRHILIKHARVAGLKATYLGSHVLRYANAARQIDVGTPPQVLSHLFGHSDPQSISAYVRIATESLREVSLPVPT